MAIIFAPGDRELAARRILLEDDVHHAGDGVGTVLGGGAVQQHFDMVDRRFRDQRQVGARSCRTPESPRKNVQIAGIVAAIAVHQHQGVVRGKARSAAESVRLAVSKPICWAVKDGTV